MHLVSLVNKSASDVSASDNLIPNKLIQTFKHNQVDVSIQKNIDKILEMNEHLEYLFFDDEQGESFLRTNFDESVVNAFKKLNIGAAKGDFLRYCFLYIHGGIYLDLDSTIKINVKEFFDEKDEFVFFFDGAHNLVNWIMITKPRLQLMKKVIDECVIRINRHESNIFLTTGPTLLNDVFFSFLTKKSLYNTNKSLNSKQRKELIEEYLKENTAEEIGKLFLEESSKISFTFDGYQKSMIYSHNNPRYIPTWGRPTPTLYKTNVF